MNLDTAAGPVLYLSGVTVTFDGFRALDSLSLLVEPGELRCIIGPNGAGKTTLMDVITGRTRPDVGEVQYGEANDLTRMSEAEIVHAGIGRKFQKPTIFRAHTVFENLEIVFREVRDELILRVPDDRIHRDQVDVDPEGRLLPFLRPGRRRRRRRGGWSRCLGPHGADRQRHCPENG